MEFVEKQTKPPNLDWKQYINRRGGHRPKRINVPMIQRLIRLLDIEAGQAGGGVADMDDLGSGNGYPCNVVALLTGAWCSGVDLCAESVA